MGKPAGKFQTTDASALANCIRSLGRHVMLAEALIEESRRLLDKTQNKETCDEQPGEPAWYECKDMLENLEAFAAKWGKRGSWLRRDQN